MVVHERTIDGGREVSLEVWDGTWVVVVLRGMDILSIEEFDDPLEAQKGYRSVR